MTHELRTVLRRFTNDKEGSIAVMSTGVFLLCLLVAGITIDYARLTKISSTLEVLNDQAALAAAKDPGLSLAQREGIFEDFLEYNLGGHDGYQDYTYNLSYTENEYEIVLAVDTHVVADLLFYSNEDDPVEISASSEVTVGKEFVEVALVLDISTSMRGSRIIEMQAAAKTFISALLENPDTRERMSIALIPYGGTVRVPQEMRHMLIEPATTEHWLDGNWNGCFEGTTHNYSNGLAPGDRLGYLPTFSAYRYLNDWCPYEGSELMGLTNDQAKLEATVDSFLLSDGTGTDIGAAWGLATLDPEWRGEFPDTESELPRDYNEGTKKIMIIMSDGGITGQVFPKNSEMDEHPYRSRNYISSDSVHNGQYNDICDKAKDNDIEIYTIGFTITNVTHINRLKACATDDTNHYDAELGELETTFRTLANSVSPLRLSR